MKSNTHHHKPRGNAEKMSDKNSEKSVECFGDLNLEARIKRVWPIVCASDRVNGYDSSSEGKAKRATLPVSNKSQNSSASSEQRRLLTVSRPLPCHIHLPSFEHRPRPFWARLQSQLAPAPGYDLQRSRQPTQT